ncbi:MAG: hypothetical protein JWN34_730 [Bryobacterales bacterium]|nr:hypothetical protein [Bryobacterales bacterium]
MAVLCNTVNMSLYAGEKTIMQNMDKFRQIAFVKSYVAPKLSHLGTMQSFVLAALGEGPDDGGPGESATS